MEKRIYLKALRVVLSCKKPIHLEGARNFYLLAFEHMTNEHRDNINKYLMRKTRQLCGN